MMGMLRVFTFDCYALLDSGATLSSVMPYMATRFEIHPEYFLEPFFVSILISESVLAERIYRDYVVSFNYRDTLANFIELEMIDFDMIFGIDWLHPTMPPSIVGSR